MPDWAILRLRGLGVPEEKNTDPILIAYNKWDPLEKSDDIHPTRQTRYNYISVFPASVQLAGRDSRRLHAPNLSCGSTRYLADFPQRQVIASATGQPKPMPLDPTSQRCTHLDTWLRLVFRAQPSFDLLPPASDSPRFHLPSSSSSSHLESLPGHPLASLRRDSL